MAEEQAQEQGCESPPPATRTPDAPAEPSQRELRELAQRLRHRRSPAEQRRYLQLRRAARLSRDV